MRPTHLIVIATALAGSLLPTRAAACLGAFAQRYVFQKDLPAHLAPGLSVLKVNVTTIPATWQDIDVTLAEPKMGVAIGSPVHILTGIGTSCSQWGWHDGPVYVVGVWVSIQGRVVFAAAQLPVVSNYRLEPEMRAKLIEALIRMGYSDLVARASILIAEARLGDFGRFEDLLADVERQAGLLDPSIKPKPAQ